MAFQTTTQDLLYLILTQLGGNLSMIQDRYNNTTDDLLYAIYIKLGGGTSGTAAIIGKVETGALEAGVLKTLSHDLDRTSAEFIVRDGDNIVEVDLIRQNPADPSNKFDIEIPIDKANLTVTVIAYNEITL